MIGMEMGEEHSIKGITNCASLGEAVDDASTGVEDILLAVCLNQGARPESVWGRKILASAQERYAKLLRDTNRRNCDQNET